jgi:excisionase family DNA binding protein
MSTPQLMTATEVCAALRCSRATLYREVSRGGLPKPRKLGSRSRWDAGELARALGKLPAELADMTHVIAGQKRGRRRQ